MGDPRVIDLSHLNIADVRTIDLSRLGIPDGQPAAPGTSYGQGPLQKPARPIRDEAGNANALPDAKTPEISLSLIKGALAGASLNAGQPRVATTMAETGWKPATRNMSPEQATLQDLKAIAGLVPAAVKGAVKGIPGRNARWRQAWATDPVGTALGLLAVLGGGEGVSEGGPYLSRSAEAADFLTRKGIPADQVAETFKTIEKAQAAGGSLENDEGGPVEAENNGS